MLESIIGIFMKEILGISILSILGLIVIVVLVILYSKYKKKVKEDKTWIDTLFINLVEEHFDKIDSVFEDDEEVQKLLDFLEKEYIGSPADTDEEVAEKIKKKKKSD